MDNKLENIIDQALKAEIRVELGWDDERDERYYQVYGFSKSGSVNIVPNRNQEEIEVHARYNEVSVIEDFKGLAEIAFDWYKRYRDTEPFTYPDSQWQEIFERFGWIKAETVSIQKITIL